VRATHTRQPKGDTTAALISLEMGYILQDREEFTLDDPSPLSNVQKAPRRDSTAWISVLD